MNDQSWFQQWNTLAFAVEQNLDNDIALYGMTINKEVASGTCILWEVEIQRGGDGLINKGNKGYYILLYFMIKLKAYLL